VKRRGGTNPDESGRRLFPPPSRIYVQVFWIIIFVFDIHQFMLKKLLRKVIAFNNRLTVRARLVMLIFPVLP